MLQHHVECLQKHAHLLQSHINLEVLEGTLLKFGLLSLDTLKDVWKSNSDSVERTKHILNLLPKLGHQAFYKFITCLLISKQFSAVRLLEPKLVVPTEDGHNGIVKCGVPLFRQPEFNAYAMHSHPRGRVLIISNIQFEEHTGLDYRAGGEKDEVRLKNLFESLDFVVDDVHRNLTGRDMKEKLKKFAAMDHSSMDAAIVIIMSHGDESNVFGTDGLGMRLNFAFKKLNSENCKDLAGKPKFFIVQACRGDKLDHGASYCKQISFVPDMPEKIRLPTLPTFSDMKICYGTYKGYKSIRSHENGSWLMSTLVDVIQMEAATESLDNMLKKITKINGQLETLEGHKQSITVEDVGWTHELYFNPGYYFEQ